MGWVYSILTGLFLFSLALGILWAGLPKESTSEVCEPHPGRAIQAASTTKEYDK
jgi:hypothetical protein